MNDLNILAAVDKLEMSFSVLFPLFGIGSFVGGMIFRRRLKKKIAGCERTSGTVVDNVSEWRFTRLASDYKGKGSSMVYLPVVEYFVGDKRFQVTGDTAYNPPKANGTHLTVLFRPAHPSEAYVEKDYYLGPNIMLALGALFMSVGSVLAYELILRHG